MDRGDRVHKGQVVARLESDVEQANAQIAAVHAANETAIASGHARVEFLQRKMGRNEQLRTGNIVSFAQADEAASDEKVAEAQLHEAELNVAQARLEARRALGLLRQREVVSPVNGVVTERALGPGEFRHDQTHILTVAEMDPLRVEAFLPIAAYGQIKPGDTATVTPEQPVGGAYTATVMVVDRVMGRSERDDGGAAGAAEPGFGAAGRVHCRVEFAGVR